MYLYTLSKQTKKLLGDHCSRFEQTANSTTKDPLHNAMNHVRNLQSMKKMKLVNEKSLYIVNHKSGKENGNIGSHHDRQTNAGYSRNKLGGPFTSWFFMRIHMRIFAIFKSFFDESRYKFRDICLSVPRCSRLYPNLLVKRYKYPHSFRNI